MLVRKVKWWKDPEVTPFSLFRKTGIPLILVIVIGSNNNKNNYSMLRMSEVPPELLNVNIIVT